MRGGAVVTTDGSCRYEPRSGSRGLAVRAAAWPGGHEGGIRGSRGAGGWCAVVEVGSDGWVLRGRERATTSTRMELLAMIEGLRSLPDRMPAELRTDATVALLVLDRWQLGQLPARRHASLDQLMWLELAAELGRLGRVRVVLVRRRDMNRVHGRAHAIANAEARALAEGREPRVPWPTPQLLGGLSREPLTPEEIRLGRRLRRADARPRAVARR